MSSITIKPNIKFVMDESFEAACKPVLEWINNKANPHSVIIIDATSAVLYSGEKSITTEEFIKD